MSILINSGTIRYEANENLFAWPLYINPPAGVQDTLPLSLAQSLDTLLGEDTPGGRIIKPHVTMTISPVSGEFKADGRKITPDDDATAETAEVKAALDAFYGPNRDSDYAEIYRLLNLQDEPDTVVTQKVSKPVIKNVNGQLRRVMEPVDEPVMEEVPVYDESGVEVIDTIKQQKIRKGKKVSDEQKQRLAELLERVRNV